MGEFFALVCGLVWSLAVILFRKSGQVVPPLALNLFRVVVSSIAFLITLAVLQQPLLRNAPLQDYLLLSLSGLIAIALSDTLFHHSLNRVGAGINAIVDTLYSPLVVVFAFFLLGERFHLRQIGGMVLIIGGVLATTRVQPPPGMTRRQLLVGIAFGVAAMISLSLGIVIAKPVLEHADVLWATAVRQLAALLGLIPMVLVQMKRREVLEVFRPQRTWRFTLPGTLLGSYVALILWIAGMKYTQTGTAAILNQTSTIFILIMASLLLKEPFSRRKFGAALLTIAGIVLVIWPA